MNVEGAYDTREEMKKEKCPFIDNMDRNCFSDNCPLVRFGTLGRSDGQQIKKFWCGAGDLT